VSSSRKLGSAVVLLVLALERIAYYGLVFTFYLFLNKGPWSPHEAWDSLDALNAVFVLLGCSYLTALLGGYIADAWAGRYRTIAAGLVLCVLGFLLLILISVDRLPRWFCAGYGVAAAVSHGVPHAPCGPAVYTAVVVEGVGVGLVKANIGPFGAEQLGAAHPSLTRSYFNWYYWTVNVGSVLGVGALAWLEQDGPGLCANGFLCGYSVAAGCLLLALVILLAASPLLYRTAPASSPLLNILRITAEASQIRLRRLFSRGQGGEDSHGEEPLVRPGFLDYAKVRYGGRFHESAVENVRAVGSMVRLFASLLPYWLVYFQMQTSFQAQALHMRFTLVVPAGNYSGEADVSAGFMEEDKLEDQESLLSMEVQDTQFSVPAAWLTLFNQALLVVSLPILTRIVYPFMDRAGLRLSVLFRIGLGMAVSSLAVFVAGGLETYRTNLWRTDNSTHIIQTVGNSTYNGVDISVFWQIPQYLLLAVAEGLTSIGGLEYAYNEAPRSFQSLVMGLFYSTEGVGSFLGIALLQILAPFWLSDMTDYANINDNHLDYYLYFLGIIQLVMLVVYTVTIYVSRFRLELVPLPCDDGIGGSHYRRRTRRRSSDSYSDGADLLAAEPPTDFETGSLGRSEALDDWTDQSSVGHNSTFGERLREDLLRATGYHPHPPLHDALPTPTPPNLFPPPTPPPLGEVDAPPSWSNDGASLVAAVERDALRESRRKKRTSREPSIN